MTFSQKPFNHFFSYWWKILIHIYHSNFYLHREDPIKCWNDYHCIAVFQIFSNQINNKFSGSKFRMFSSIFTIYFTNVYSILSTHYHLKCKIELRWHALTVALFLYDIARVPWNILAANTNKINAFKIYYSNIFL